jgi:hypothetical protein
MADYLTLAEFRQRGKIITTDSNKEALMTALITAASRLIDRLTMRAEGAYAIGSTSTQVARYFDRQKPATEAWIDECTALSVVQISDDNGSTYYTLAATDYWTSDGAQYGGTPIQLLVANPNGSYPAFYGGIRALKVTARWGYSATPPESIKEAAFHIAHSAFLLADTGANEPQTMITSTGLVIPPNAISPAVKLRLSPFMKRI